MRLERGGGNRTHDTACASRDVAIAQRTRRENPSPLSTVSVCYHLSNRKWVRKDSNLQLPD